MSDVCPFHKLFSFPVDREFYDVLVEHFCLCQALGIEVHKVDTENPVSTPVTSPYTSPDTTSSNTLEYPCPSPTCSAQFKRWQDRNRHLLSLSHLPYWIHCPLQDCNWRNSRVDVFWSHWENNHPQYSGGTPEPSDYTVYDPEVVLDPINRGTSSVAEAVEIALGLVREKADQLQKPSLWVNPWGGVKGHRSKRA